MQHQISRNFNQIRKSVVPRRSCTVQTLNTVRSILWLFWNSVVHHCNRNWWILMSFLSAGCICLASWKHQFSNFTDVGPWTIFHAFCTAAHGRIQKGDRRWQTKGIRKSVLLAGIPMARLFMSSAVCKPWSCMGILSYSICIRDGCTDS